MPCFLSSESWGVQFSGHNEDLRRWDLNSVAEGKEVNLPDVISSNRWTKREEMIAANAGSRVLPRGCRMYDVD